MLFNTFLDAPTTNESNNQPQFIRPHATHILASSLKKSLRQHTKSPLIMLEQFPPMISSRTTSRLIILSSTFSTTTNIYGIKNLKQFVNTPLPDNIHKCGAMTTLITDGGKYEVSKKVTCILHTVFISQY